MSVTYKKPNINSFRDLATRTDYTAIILKRICCRNRYFLFFIITKLASSWSSFHLLSWCFSLVHWFHRSSFCGKRCFTISSYSKNEKKLLPLLLRLLQQGFYEINTESIFDMRLEMLYRLVICGKYVINIELKLLIKKKIMSLVF